MKKTLIPFGALCLAAPSVLLLVCQTYAWNESVAMASLAVGVLLAVALLACTCLSFYRRRRRAFVGLLACGFCFWQFLVIPGFMHAVKIRRDKQRPNQTGAVDGGVPLRLQMAPALPATTDPNCYA
jgi:amino acid transporter